MWRAFQCRRRTFRSATAYTAPQNAWRVMLVAIALLHAEFEGNYRVGLPRGCQGRRPGLCRGDRRAFTYISRLTIEVCSRPLTDDRLCLLLTGAVLEL